MSDGTQAEVACAPPVPSEAGQSPVRRWEGDFYRDLPRSPSKRGRAPEQGQRSHGTLGFLVLFFFHYTGEQQSLPPSPRPGAIVHMQMRRWQPLFIARVPATLITTAADF